ncbi:MAG: CsbD family protein [Candidatus Acidiferrales bacterium]
MRSSMKDQVEGNIHDLKGNVKQKAGRLTNDPRLEAKGQAEKIAGKVQKKIGQMKRVVGK